MADNGRLITFTNLFPSAERPTHGLFVRERVRRVVAAMPGLDWVVVCPVPVPPPGLRRGDYARFARMPEREVVDGVEVWHPRYGHLPGLSVARQASGMARAARGVLADLVARRPAVVDAHYAYPDGVAAVTLATELGLPALVTARGTDVNVLAQRPRVRAQLRAWMPRAFACLAVSEPLRRRFAVAAGLDDGCVRLSRNGVDLARFAPGDAAAARAELGLPATGKLVLGVGRLVRSKGFHIALEALRSHDSVRLVLVGDGDQRSNLLSAAPAGKVLCLGAQPPERVALAYRACDVLVLPSEREGWPNVVTEALASGLPVVAHAVGAVPTMLDDPACGAAVPAGDARAFGERLSHFLANAPDRAQVRASACRFSWEEPIQELVGLVRAALESPA